MALDSQLVVYTGAPTTTVPILANQNLQLILQNIDAAINAHNTAPDYTGYNLYCVTQTDGITHPTNTQNFAEGISKILCDLNTAYDTFVTSTYVSDSAVFTSAINGLQLPALTYATFGITNTDTVTQVWNKVFAGLNVFGTNTTTSTFDPFTANWATLSITPSHSTITTWNNVIAYLSAMASTVAGKQTAIANIDNSANCLSGTSSDTIRATVLLQTTKICSLPEFDAGTITNYGVTSASDLQGYVQNIINTASSLLTTAVVAQGTGLTIAAVGSTYQGKQLAIDTTYTQLYKVAVDNADAVAATEDFLENKIIDDGSTISITKVGAQLVVSSLITGPTYTVKVNSSDSTAGYIASKIQGQTDSNWGLGINVTASLDNSLLYITPTVDPLQLSSNLLTYWSNTPDIFTQFQQLVNQTTGGSCAVPTAFTVVKSGGDFALAWTPSGSADSQNAKWRTKGSATWITSSGITPANPLLTSDATVDVAGGSAGLVNIVTEFAIDSICSGGGIGTSAIYEMVVYQATTVSKTRVGGVISVNQNPLPTIDIVEYRLLNSVPAVIQNISTTGLNPTGSFASVTSGTYTVEYRFGTLVNGLMLYSDDASQLTAWTGAGTIVVP